MLVFAQSSEVTNATPIERYITVGGALGVAITAALVVIRIQRTSVVDMRADRSADRSEILELRADRDADRTVIDAMRARLDVLTRENALCLAGRRADEQRIAALEAALAEHVARTTPPTKEPDHG
jgi:hypothetical protein